MSGVSELVVVPIAAVAIVPLAAFTLAAGALAAADKVFDTAAKAAYKAAESRRISRLQGKLGEFTGSLEELSVQISERQLEAAGQCEADISREMSALERSLKDGADLSDYAKKCALAKEKALDAITEKTRAVEKQCEKELFAEKKRIDRELTARRRSLTDRMAAFEGSTAEHDELCRQTALAAVKDAEETVSQLAEHYGECAGKYITALRGGLEKARERFARGEYEAAVTDACAVTEQAVTRAADILAAEREKAVLYARACAAAEELSQYLDRFRSVEYTLDTGEDSINVKAEDFTVFFMGEWEPAESMLSRMKKRLEAGDYTVFAVEELIDICDGLEKTSAKFLSDLKKAYDRLQNNLIRNEYADIMSRTYAEMGFEELEPEGHDPIEKTVMLLRHEISGELVRVTMYPKEKSDGTLETIMEIESRDDDPQNELTEENRRFQRDRVCRGLSESPLGRRMKLSAHHNCKRGTENKNGFGEA